LPHRVLQDLGQQRAVDGLENWRALGGQHDGETAFPGTTDEAA
jgi:hypothetical protein